MWPDLFSTPQSYLNNASFFVPMCAVVGGGSTVNAMPTTSPEKIPPMASKGLSKQVTPPMVIPEAVSRHLQTLPTHYTNMNCMTENF
jgi:hypothetical protein